MTYAINDTIRFYSETSEDIVVFEKTMKTKRECNYYEKLVRAGSIKEWD